MTWLQDWLSLLTWQVQMKNWCAVCWPSSTFLPVGVTERTSGPGEGCETSAWQQDKQWWRTDASAAKGGAATAGGAWPGRRDAGSRERSDFQDKTPSKGKKKIAVKTIQSASHIWWRSASVRYPNKQDLEPETRGQDFPFEQMSLITSFTSVRRKTEKAGQRRTGCGKCPQALTDSDHEGLSEFSLNKTDVHTVAAGWALQTQVHLKRLKDRQNKLFDVKFLT